jgi:transcription elongation factor/antiterminator RfaH
MSWYAIYTKPRHEKKVNTLLQDKRFETYLPLIKQTRQWKDRKKKVDMPLFNSYIFVNFDYKYRFDVLQTDGVVKVVNFNSQPAVVPDWQIESLRKMLDHPETLKLEHYFKAGELVEVTTGPLKGLRGVIMRRKGEHRLVLTIDGIMQSVSVEVSAADLVRVKE